MTTSQFSLSTPADVLLSLEIDDAVVDSEDPQCWTYSRIFFDKSQAAEGTGNTDVAIAWRLLAQLCQIGLQAESGSEAFRPMFEDANGRSMLPVDLDQTTTESLRQLGLRIRDPELKARLLDIVWDRARDAAAARTAVSSYVDAAERLFHLEDWVQYVDRIERAIRLAGLLNDKDLIESVVKIIEKRIVSVDGDDPLYMTSRLMELLLEWKKGDPAQMIDIAQRAAKSAARSGDFERVRSHLENVRRWARRASDKSVEQDAAIGIAESYTRQADLHPEQGGELLVAHWLEKAHESYRNIPGMADKVEEVYRRLRRAQQAVLGAVGQVSSGDIDISDIIKTSRSHVSGKAKNEALLALATVVRPTNFNRETEHARELADRFPLQHLMGGVKIDRDGRVIAHRTPAIGGDKAEMERALWERVVEQVAMSYQLDAQAAIIPALEQLTFEHALSLRDMHYLVVDNPFVPPGHEELYARGFLAGFRWNLPDALSILIPQLENSLRHLLATAGVEVTRRDKHGIQSVIQFGTILSSYPQLESILGVDAVKELKVLFSDQHGPDLRNSIAHGLYQHDEFFSLTAIYAWWFIFHLCILPVHHRFIRQNSKTKEMT